MPYTLLLIAIFVVGLLIPEANVTPDVRGAIVTFFGLLGAGLIPAISLLMSAPYPTSRSVKRINELDIKVGALSKKLMQTLAFLVLGGLLLIVAEFGLPEIKLSIPAHPELQQWIETLPNKFINSAVLTCLLLSLDRLRLFATTFSTVRSIRHEMAVEEAKEKLSARTPEAEHVRRAFKTSAAHGKNVALLVCDDENN